MQLNARPPQLAKHNCMEFRVRPMVVPLVRGCTFVTVMPLVANLLILMLWARLPLIVQRSPRLEPLELR